LAGPYRAPIMSGSARATFTIATRFALLNDAPETAGGGVAHAPKIISVSKAQIIVKLLNLLHLLTK
jgi:hypothetical protein